MNALPLAGAVFGVALIAQSAPPGAQMPPDLQARETNLAQLAIEAGAQGDVRPIPLVSEGQRYGAIYDRFLLGVVAAKAALAEGKTPSAESRGVGQGLVPLKLVIVAEPLMCGGRPNVPKEVQLNVSSPPFSGPVQPLAPVVKGDAAASVLPGLNLPETALVASFANAPLSATTSVRIEYEAPACPNSASAVTFSTQLTVARSTGPVVVKLPEGAGLPSPSVVRFRVLVDQQGKLRFPSRVEGESALEQAALAALEKVTFEPSRINGTPVPATVVFPVTFTATGAPVASSGPTPIANTTVGGRPAGNRTPDVPNLTAESSRCPISDDAKYGYSAENPIKVDGGAREGPPRERRYLDTLRGPTGQGLQYRRLGSVMGPDKQTILDMYEVVYDGIDTPVRLFLDEYHSGDLKAPKGFVCAAPFNLNR